MQRLTCLDGLRGVLALYVMASHTLPFAAVPGWIAAPFAHGGAAVDMFFVLSGLVIVRSLPGFAGRPGAFLRARVLRIFPLYLLALAAALALRPWDHGIAAMPWIGPDSPARVLVSDGWPDAAGWEIGAHLLMLHGMFPDGVAPYLWVRFLGPAWSLSTEWQFYVLALLLAGARLLPGRMALVLLGIGAAGLGWHMMAPDFWQFSRAFLPNKAAYFALGVASAGMVACGKRALALYLAVLAGALVVCADQGGASKLAVPLGWSLCLGAELGWAAPLAALLRQRGLLWLGAISYPVYIVHEPIHKLLSMLLAPLAAGDALLFTALWLPAAILAPIGLAWWLHRAVELPAQRWGKATRRLTPAPV